MMSGSGNCPNCGIYYIRVSGHINSCLRRYKKPNTSEKVYKTKITELKNQNKNYKNRIKQLQNLLANKPTIINNHKTIVNDNKVINNITINNILNMHNNIFKIFLKKLKNHILHILNNSNSQHRGISDAKAIIYNIINSINTFGSSDDKHILNMILNNTISYDLERHDINKDTIDTNINNQLDIVEDNIFQIICDNILISPDEKKRFHNYILNLHTEYKK